MKKYLFALLCMLLCLTDGIAGILCENIEIDGFIYKISDTTVSGKNCRGDAWMTGMTDQRYEETLETHELSLPSFVVYEGGRYSVAISYESKLFWGRDFSHLESIKTTPYSIGCIYDMPNLKSITGGTEVHNFDNTLWGLPELRNLELPTESFLRIYWSFWNVGLERLVFSPDLSLRRPEVSFLNLPNLIELSLCYIDYCDSCFKELPQLEEITFQRAPNMITRSFKHLPILKKIIFKRWNDKNQINILNSDSFDEVPLLKDVFVEESAPCELVYAGSSFDPSRMTLHVPVGSRELYIAADGWKDFGEIVEYDPAGVEIIEVDAQTKRWSCHATIGGVSISANSSVEVKMLTPAGTMVKSLSLTAGETVPVELPTGVYIVVCNGQSEKVCVR